MEDSKCDVEATAELTGSILGSKWSPSLSEQYAYLRAEAIPNLNPKGGVRGMQENAESQGLHLQL